MSVQELSALALELRAVLKSGAFAQRGRVALNDGVTVNPERMARIILVDIERVARNDHGR